MKGYFQHDKYTDEDLLIEDICALLKARGAYNDIRIPAQELAEKLGMDQSRIKAVLEKMEDKGFVKLSREFNVGLTDKGKKTGSRIIKKHNIIEALLMAFGVKKQTAHREALKLEHTVSDELMRELGHISKKGELIQLTSLKAGDEGQIVLIKAGKAATQRLNEMGLVPETRIKILRIGAFNGPVELLARDSHLVIGQGLASKVYVRPLVSVKGKENES